MLKKLVMTIGTAILVCVGLNANASVVIHTTRVIFNQSKGEAVVQLSNKGQEPLLVQSWIDDGDAQADPSTINVPFAINPSVFRMDPEKGRVVRIFNTTNDLPKDRESLFWFNILEIPPTVSKDADKNFIQVAFRSRIKLLYRPDSLSMTAMEAYNHLTYKLRASTNGYEIVVTNPSPYYITFSKVELRLPNNHTVAAKMVATNDKIIAPFGELVLPLPGLKAIPSGEIKLSFTVINDSGGSTSGEKSISH